MRHKPKTKRKRRRKRLAEAAARRKSKKKSRRALLQFCRQHLVLKKNLAQQANTSASEGDPQSDESIYYASTDGEIHTTASSKSENVDSHPTELSVSSYSGHNHLHSFTKSFSYADA